MGKRRKRKKGPLIDDIRAVRHEISAECGHDTRALLEFCRQVERRYADRMLPPTGRLPPDRSVPDKRSG